MRYLSVTIAAFVAVVALTILFDATPSNTLTEKARTNSELTDNVRAPSGPQLSSASTLAQSAAKPVTPRAGERDNSADLVMDPDPYAFDETLAEVEHAIADEQQRGMALVAHLERTLSNEPLDSAWSATTNQQIDQAFSGTEWEHSKMLDSTCQSSLCRVEVEHFDPRARAEFIGTFARVEPFTGTAVFYHNTHEDEGVSRTVLYVARKGQGLPQ